MQPPRRIGNYEILSVLGTGAMGVVYLARNPQASRDVAIKLLKPTEATRHLLKRFHTEVEALSRLRHPGIVQILETGVVDLREGKAPFIVMEHVHGRRLDDYAAQMRLDLPRRIDLLAHICDIVEYAHSKGLLHRDLKPANILIDDSAQPHILDFGIAQAIDLDAQYMSESAGKPGIAGSLAYMSPEQAAREPRLDLRCDVYSLGVIAYELISGRLPYDLRVKSLAAVISTIRNQSPRPIGEVEPRACGDLELVIDKALQKPRHDRYDSAKAMGDDLRRVLKNEPPSVRRGKLRSAIDQVAKQTREAVDVVSDRVKHALHRPQEQPHAPPPAAAVEPPVRFKFATWQDRFRNAHAQMRHGDFAMALLWFVSALKKSAGETRAEPMIRTCISLALPQAPRLLDVDPTSIERGGLPPADRILEINNDDRAGMFTARMIDQSTGRTLLGPLWHHASVSASYFSADSRAILTVCRDDVVRVWSDAPHGPVATIAAHRGAVNFVGFSPDGTQLLTAGADGRARLFRSGTWQPLAELTHEGPIHHAAFSHHGRLIVTGGEDRTARIWDTTTGQPIGAPIVHDHPIVEVHFVRESKQIMCASADGSARVWEVATGKAFSPPLRSDTAVYRQLMKEARSRGAPQYSSRRLAQELAPPLARIIAAVSGGSGAAPADARRGAGAVAFAALAPDGRLAVTIDARSEALVWDVNNAVSLSAGLDPINAVTHAAFSPDSRLLAVGSSDGTVRVWSVEPDNRSLDNLHVIAEALTCHLIDDALGLYPLGRGEWQSAVHLMRRE